MIKLYKASHGLEISLLNIKILTFKLLLGLIVYKSISLDYNDLRYFISTMMWDESILKIERFRHYQFNLIYLAKNKANNGHGSTKESG